MTFPPQLDTVVDICADDTMLSFSSDVRKAPDTLSTSLQRDMDEVVRWSNENMTILNGSKTKCMMVTGKRLAKNMDEDQLLLKINRKRLEQVTSQKLLGVIIDDKLNFDDDIEELCKKISQRIAVLKKIICFMPLEQRMLYFNSMIKQVMLYGSSLWTSNTIDSLA